LLIGEESTKNINNEKALPSKGVDLKGFMSPPEVL